MAEGHSSANQGASVAPPLWKKLVWGTLLLLLVVAAIAALSVGLGQLAVDGKGTLDFANFYAAGRIVSQGQSHLLYNIGLQRIIEGESSAGGPFQPYYHPPFEALLFAALSTLAYPDALRVWAGINLFLVGLIAYLLRFAGHRIATGEYLAWLFVSAPLVIGAILLGQDTLLLALIFLVSFLAFKKRWDFTAGLALGLGLFRFEILLPFAFVFILRRRWKMLAGFSITAVAAALASLAVVGWGGLLTYIGALLKVGSSAGQWATMADPATMPTLRGAMATLLGGVVPPEFLFPAVLAGTLVLLGWAAWQFKHVANPENPSFDLEFSLATLAALLASYHLFVHELTLLIVVGYLMLGFEGAKPREGILGNRQGTALLLIFALVFGVGGAVFHFRDFSVLFIVLLGMMIWLSQEISELRSSGAVAR